MRLVAAALLSCLLFGVNGFAQDSKEQKPACISIDKAKDFVGQEVCVVGEVHHVGFTDSGTAFITFCEDYKKCPFTAVVFARDVDKVGNLQMFEGRELEVTGKIREYEGSAEMVIKKRSQFGGEAISPIIDRPAGSRNRRWHR